MGLKRWCHGRLMTTMVPPTTVMALTFVVLLGGSVSTTHYVNGEEDSEMYSRSSIPSLEEFLLVCPLICSTQWHFELSEFDSPATCIQRMCGETPVVSEAKLMMAAAKNRTYSISNVLRMCHPMCESEWWLDSLSFFESIDDCYSQICPQKQTSVLFNKKYDDENIESEPETAVEQQAPDHSEIIDHINKMVKPATEPTTVAPISAGAIQAILNRRLAAQKASESQSNAPKTQQQQPPRHRPQQHRELNQVQAQPRHQRSGTPQPKQMVGVDKHDSKMTQLLRTAAQTVHVKPVARAGPSVATSGASCARHTDCAGNDQYCTKRKVCAERSKCSVGGYDQQPVNGLCPRMISPPTTGTHASRLAHGIEP
eukprot:m.32105 g.32105  ORF g.32105 m.32105 type:complete len:369 (-) comp16584_c0_seq1:150-1256(-)